MGGIIYRAIRELAIEETVTDIVATWDSMAFIVLKYQKEGAGAGAVAAPERRRTEVVETQSDREDSLLLQNNRPNNGNGDRSDGQEGKADVAEEAAEEEEEVESSSPVPVVDQVPVHFYDGAPGEVEVNHHLGEHGGDLHR